QYEQAWAQGLLNATSYRDHGDYRRETEQTMQALADRSASPIHILPMDVADLLAYAQRTGKDPAARPTRLAYTGWLHETGHTGVLWPPERNSPCWCGSATKYKKCCGNPVFLAVEPPDPASLILRIDLDGVTPAVWRRVAIPSNTTLDVVHRMIQDAMGWYDEHMYVFETDEHTIIDPRSDSGEVPADGERLVSIATDVGAAFTYVYDFGDEWRHTVTVEEIRPGGPGIPQAAARDDGLLADIDAFAQRARDGEFDASHHGYNDDWYDDYHDDEYRADAEWVQEADPLFAAAGQVFLAGHLDQAREAYHRLFTLFRPSHQGGADLDTWMLATTDLAEAAARYLRCVYDTTPAPQRGPAVYQAYTALNAGPQPPLLRDIATARRGDLPDLPAFLPSWIDALLAETPALSTGQRRRLLTEATLMHRGVDGLADLAHRPGPHQPGTYLDWIDALTDAGRIGHAADAAREALTITPAAPIHLAHAADRLAELATRLRDLSGAVEARRRAWRADPTRERLIALVTTARVAGTEDRTLAAETRHARGRTDRLSGELFLLAGRIDTAAAALTHAPSRGWSRPAHPGL